MSDTSVIPRRAPVAKKPRSMADYAQRFASRGGKARAKALTAKGTDCNGGSEASNQTNLLSNVPFSLEVLWQRCPVPYAAIIGQRARDYRVRTRPSLSARSAASTP